jgi:hypothetical protein
VSERGKAVTLVAGRACGACDVCCVSLLIDTADLQKHAGVPCHHLDGDRRCGIYETRYAGCRAFHCGYRQLPWLPDTMRPDQAGVVVLPRMTDGAGAPGGQAQASVVFVILDEASLDSDALVTSMIAAVREEVLIELSVQGPPGFASTRIDISEELLLPAMMRDRRQIQGILREAYAYAKAVERPPVAFRNGNADRT